MHRHWSQFVNRLLLALMSVSVMGWLVGYPFEVIALFLAAYLFWTVSQACRLHRWLHQGLLSDPPESRGLWGELFDAIYRIQLKHMRSQDKLQSLIDRIQESTNALKDAVIMTDQTGAMDWWNEAAERLLGFRYPTDRGILIQNLIRAPEFKAYFMSKRYQDPLPLVSPVDASIQLQFQITLFGEDDRLIVAQDISRLVRLEQMRRDFVSNVSHELRTPLTVITGYLETLLDNGEELPPKWSKALKQMQSQSIRMEALITDLLLLSRIENQGRNYFAKPVDVPKLLRATLEDARAVATPNTPPIDLQVDTTLCLKGDETQLRSAFTNLAINAVKYSSSPNGHIRMRWFEDAKGLCFSVQDTGIGIDPIHIPRITERFYRADPSRHSSSGGTGLGLAIVKHVLINHEGHLEIQSQPGVGSTFSCHFPRTRAAKPEDATAN